MPVQLVFLRSSTGHPMEQGEKYACAELMVDEIKSAGGIMPKVSQTLAMKPDVVKVPRRGRKMGRVARYHDWIATEGWGKMITSGNGRQFLFQRKARCETRITIP